MKYKSIEEINQLVEEHTNWLCNIRDIHIEQQLYGSKESINILKEENKLLKAVIKEKMYVDVNDYMFLNQRTLVNRKE